MAVTEPKPIPPVNPDCIADEMKDAGRRWTMWHGVWQPKKGKYDKYPCDSDGKRIQWSDPDKWITFDDAYDGHMADPSIVSGIGMFTGYDEDTNLTYWLFDADHVLSNGKLDSMTQSVLDGFNYGYRELSVGLDGVHIVFATEGEVPKCGQNPDDSVYELYNGGRFMTVTGHEYQNGAQPFVAPIEAVESLVELAGLRPLRGRKASREGDAEDGGGAADPINGECEAQRPSEWMIREAKSYLAAIPAEKASEETWRNVGMALHEGGYEYGVWDEWNKTDPARYDESANRKRWDSFGNYDGGELISFGYLVALAYKHGWYPDRPPMAGPFYFDNGILWRKPKTQRGKHERVTNTPPFVLASVYDIDTKAERAEVAMLLPDGYGKAKKQVSFVIDRSKLLNKNTIVPELAERGGTVSTSNAGNIVEYLTICDMQTWAANRPRYTGVSRMGWVGQDYEVFMPYDEAKSSIRFDPTDDMAHLAEAFAKSKGTLEEWVAGVAPMREKHPILRTMLAASFASVLLGMLEVQPFVVYVWGFSGSGKTAANKLCCSIWGNPIETAGYFAKLGDTPSATLMRAGFLRNLPLVLDEFESARGKSQEAKRKSVEQLVYDLSYGMERNRATRTASYNRGASFNLLTIMAGETPITGDSTQQGALARILEVNGEPFDDRYEAREGHQLATSQFGAAGRAYIERLKAIDRDAARLRFEELRDKMSDALPGYPQADIFAVLAFADAMAERFIFDPESSRSWGEVAEECIASMRMVAGFTKSASEKDTDRRAIEFVAEWLSMNKVHFLRDRFTNLIPDAYGMAMASDEFTTWYVLKDPLKKALESSNFNFDKTLRRMKAEGIVKRQRDSDGNLTNSFQIKKSINGDKVNCYEIDGRALDSFLCGDDAMDPGEDTPTGFHALGLDWSVVTDEDDRDDDG